MKGQILRGIVIWIVGIGLILSVGGIFYNSWEASRFEDQVIRKQTLETAKEILNIQSKLDKNGRIAAEILDNIIRVQNGLQEKVDEVLRTQRDETTLAINEHQKISRAMFMSEFEKIKIDTKEIIAEQIRTALKDVVDKETYGKDIAKIAELLQGGKQKSK